jgi:pectin methylesterase-like acyl-CoA thioesterase
MSSSSRPSPPPLRTATMHIALAIVFVIISVTFTADVRALDVQTVINSPLLTEKISTNRTIKVDINGDGEFKSVQAAIDSVPEGNSHWVIIHVRKGVYRLYNIFNHICLCMRSL